MSRREGKVLSRRSLPSREEADIKPIGLEHYKDFRRTMWGGFSNLSQGLKRGLAWETLVLKKRLEN